MKTARSRRRYVHPLLIDHDHLSLLAIGAPSHHLYVHVARLAFYGGRRQGNLYVRARGSAPPRVLVDRPVRRWPAYIYRNFEMAWMRAS